MKETIELNGLTFKVELKPDEGMGEPWKEHDGHGIISNWTYRDKKPGERVLIADGRASRYYDIAETIKIARRDGWDAEPLGTGTPGERAARAVEADYERMRRWCNDDWSWCYVLVTLLDVDGNKTEERDSVGGVESDAGDHLDELALECAGEIAARVGDAVELKKVTRIREAVND